MKEKKTVRRVIILKLIGFITFKFVFYIFCIVHITQHTSKHLKVTLGVMWMYKDFTK